VEDYNHLQEATRIYCNADCNNPLYRSRMDTIAKRIARARELQGLNQSELARKLDLSPQAVQNWEAGKSAPKGARIRDVAQILQTTVEYLLFGNDKTGVISATSRFPDEISSVRESYAKYSQGAVEVLTGTDLPDWLEKQIAELAIELAEAYREGRIQEAEIGAIRTLIRAKR